MLWIYVFNTIGLIKLKKWPDLIHQAIQIVRKILPILIKTYLFQTNSALDNGSIFPNHHPV